jgi:hypothetical protein
VPKTDLLTDHREHCLLPDKDNQILWWKAMRDRFDSRHGYRSYLCSPRSEDILTWTVFRTLEQAGALTRVAAYLGIEVVNDLEVLYWMFHAQKLQSPEQTALWELLREVDGELGGQATEPDIVLIGQREVCFIEAKLGEPGKKPTLWFGQDAKRFPLYERYLADRQVQLFHRELSDGEKQEFYQLIRNVFYAWALGSKLAQNRKPLVVCLVNERNRTAPTRSIQESFNDFRGLLCEDGAFPRSNLALNTWQGLAEALRAGDAHERSVADHLLAHPCLALAGGGT